MTIEEQAALGALSDYLDAALALERAWQRLSFPDVLTENVPANFVEFREQIDDLVAWRDRVVAALK